MLKAYVCGGNKLNLVDFHQTSHNHDEIVWFDMISPTDEERALVEMVTKLELPSESEVMEIENSSRLSAEGEVLTLTMPVVLRLDEGLRGGGCGFVLAPGRLVTLRFADHPIFDKFPAQPHDTGHGETAHAAFIFVGLIEAFVDRQADFLEHLRARLDDFSRDVFQRQGGLAKRRGAARERDEEAKLRHMLTTLGIAYDSISFLRDSQLGVARIAPYVVNTAEWLPPAVVHRLQTVHADMGSLNEFSVHLTDKVQFLLDATLGLINIVQSTLMKVFTVVAVIGIPPTLIAGIYGMNFKDMPELSWRYGYAYGWAMIILSAVLPMVWFRVKGWL